MNKFTEQQLARVEALVEHEHYDEALAVLSTIEHPTADEWIDHIEEITLFAPPQVDSPPHRAKHKMKNSDLVAVRERYYRQRLNLVRMSIVMLIICVCIVLVSLAYASRDTSPLISDSTAIPPTADIRESIIITRPPVIWSLRNQTYDYDAPVGRSQFRVHP